MSVGDEIGYSEELYHKLVGKFVSAIEVLNQRILAKDAHIAKLEEQLSPGSAEPTSGEANDG